MSQKNVDLVRSIRAPWDHGDFRSAEWADPEIEFAIADGPSPGQWTGVAGMAEGFRTIVSAWDQFHVESEEFRELDGERVLVLVHAAGSGKASGANLVEVRTKGAELFHVRGQKVTRLVIYLNRDNALADLGLSE